MTAASGPATGTGTGKRQPGSLARLAAAARPGRRTLRRERVLRAAGEALAAADSLAEAAEAVAAAAAALVGRRRGPAAVLAVAGGEPAAGPDTAAAAGAGILGLAGKWLPLAGPRPRLLRAFDLPVALRRWAGSGSVLVCRLAGDGHPPAGVLAVFGPHRALAALSGTLEILAGQAALAVARIQGRVTAEAWFQAMTGDLGDTIMIIEDDGRIRYASPSAQRLFGSTALAGQHLADLLRPHEREEVLTAFARLRDQADQAGPGRTAGVAGPAGSATLSGADGTDGADGADGADGVPGAGPAPAGSSHQPGSSQQPAAGQPVSRAAGQPGSRTAGQPAASSQAGAVPAEELRITRPDGTAARVAVFCRDLRADPAVGALVFTLRDVTEQHRLEAELKHRAFHDALTGLPNRLLFSDRVAHALARSRRTGLAVGVLLVDLDDLQALNDTLGHGIGDELLAAAGHRLSGLVRESDTAARLSGDEFGLLIEGAANTAAVERFADRIVAAFSEPFLLSAGPVVATATVGVATTEESADAGELMRHADLALYAAKAAGKRQWRRYRPVLSVDAAKRRELRAALGEAVAGHAFAVHYQPIVALASGTVAGFEALVRWPHPQWGMLYPDEFIALAEESGHIVPLGAWVMEQAAADTARWQHRLPPQQRSLYVSVNVSARQFAHPGFVAGVERAVSGSGLPPSSLLLELTESVLLSPGERIRSDLARLKEIGVRLAIDDFGTGYSSLRYLRELPIDALKIDRSFVEGMAVSEQRLAIVEVIVRMAKTLGLTVIAEGIESEVQRDLLVSLGCEYGQGYLLERPVAADEAETLLRSGALGRLRAASP
jgi:diguanylate cyclase (GGDEF)-like protein